MSRPKPKRPKRSLAKRSREPLYLVVETDVETDTDLPVSPRFKIRNDPETWATMVFTDKRKAEAVLAQTRQMNPDKGLGVGTISVPDMLHHIQYTAAAPLLQSQGTLVQFMGPPPTHVDAICIDHETTYPLVLSAFPKVYRDDPPPYATFQESMQALLRHLKRSRSR